MCDLAYALDNAELLFLTNQSTDKVDIHHTVALHMVILGELTAFKEGLKIIGVLKNIAVLFMIFFVIMSNVYLLQVHVCDLTCIHFTLIDVDQIRNFFTTIIIVYSEKGSNAREKEEQAFMFFINYLEDVENSNCYIDLVQLIFIL